MYTQLLKLNEHLFYKIFTKYLVKKYRKEKLLEKAKWAWLVYQSISNILVLKC